jgi:hypothetical protein
MPMSFGSQEFFTELVRRFSATDSDSSAHVLLHSTNGQDAREPGAVPPPEPFEIGHNLWICRLPDQLRDIVYGICEPRDEPAEKFYRQYGQLYTIALFMGPSQTGVISSWDGYGLLSKFVTLSQLVHPTSIGFGNTAILHFDSKSDFKRASPGPCRGVSEHAFTLPETRNWLSVRECEQIKSLFYSSDFNKLSDRVGRALWNFQYAAYQYFFEVRTMLITSGIEALVHVRTIAKRKIGTGEQFTKRVVELAFEVAVRFTETDAREVWEHRSDVVHGRDPWDDLRKAQTGFQIPRDLKKGDPLVTRYLACEKILGLVVLRCLRDPAFAAKFASDQSVEKAFPI